ncbi:hypothetical protein T492DRAFT_943784 [Pavlovales sp. CCMP2436]|nr:hypothetical protein T492DRAFT_943784 [Pavlovales sp. CCMP2436]
MGPSPSFRRRVAPRFRPVVSIPAISGDLAFEQIISLAGAPTQACRQGDSLDPRSLFFSDSRSTHSAGPSLADSDASESAFSCNVAEGDLHCCLEELLAIAASSEVSGSATTRIPQLVADLTRDASELREERVTAEWLLGSTGCNPFFADESSSGFSESSIGRGASRPGQSAVTPALLLCAGLAVAVASGAAAHLARDATRLADELRASRDEGRMLRVRLASFEGAGCRAAERLSAPAVTPMDAEAPRADESAAGFTLAEAIASINSGTGAAAGAEPRGRRGGGLLPPLGSLRSRAADPAPDNVTSDQDFPKGGLDAAHPAVAVLYAAAISASQWPGEQLPRANPIRRAFPISCSSFNAHGHFSLLASGRTRIACRA